MSFSKYGAFALVFLSFAGIKDVSAFEDGYAVEEISRQFDFSETIEALEENLLDDSGVASNSKATCDFNKNQTLKEKNKIFNIAVGKLLNVNNWENILGVPGQHFKLYDSKGKAKTGDAEVGNFIEITLPMDPSMRTYWVKIEDLQYINLKNRNSKISLVVRPAANPIKPLKNVIDHFFTDEATNTFSISTTTLALTASVNGLNEKANTQKVASRTDAAANYAIANSAWGYRKNGVARLGIQSLVWNRLNTKLAKCGYSYL